MKSVPRKLAGETSPNKHIAKSIEERNDFRQSKKMEDRKHLRQFVQSGNRKTVKQVLQLFGDKPWVKGNFGYLVRMGNWRIRGFLPNRNDMAEGNGKTDSHAAHVRIGEAIVHDHADSIIDLPVPWESKYLQPVKNGSCGRCGQKITPEQQNDLKLSKLVYCKCGVMLFNPSVERSTNSGDSRKHVSPENNYSGELSDDDTFIEGAVFQVLVNRYERDPKAKASCLKELGYSCKVCGVNFGKLYGEMGDGFIHVHHRKPLALRKAEYRLNPTKDLVPVCPNCHAMLHTSDPPLEIDDLRKLMKTVRGG